MNVVFDASAVLAILNEERGFEVAERQLNDAALSIVNFMEVVTHIAKRVSSENLRAIISPFEKYVITTDHETAYLAGELSILTRRYGLSLGDRACLALALRNNWPVLTADRIWSQLELDIQINLIR